MRFLNRKEVPNSDAALRGREIFGQRNFSSCLSRWDTFISSRSDMKWFEFVRLSIEDQKLRRKEKELGIALSHMLVCWCVLWCE